LRYNGTDVDGKALPTITLPQSIFSWEFTSIMSKKLGREGEKPLPVLAICLLAILTVMITACGIGVSATSSPDTEPNTVHMNESLFVQPSITIKKGTSLTLVNDVSAVHIIANGTWDSNGTPKTNIESGAPTIDAQINGGGSKTFGPFNTAGTFLVYCPIHPGMNLTVIVQ